VLAEPNAKIEVKNCISPLTAFLLCSSQLKVRRNEYICCDEKSESDLQFMFKIFEILIERGCNINAMYLQISDTRLNEVKQNLQVPDTLFLSILTHEKLYVKALLQHWWGPPLSLLLLCTCEDDISFWMPILVRYDVVPRGMAIHQKLLDHLANFDGVKICSDDEPEEECDKGLNVYQQCISKSFFHISLVILFKLYLMCSIF
jgi:hypothetical protein